MKYLTKPCIVIWDKDTMLIQIKVTDNRQTWTSDQNGSAEFDTEQELEDFITENNLTE